jgi:hypothetical protein
MSFAPSEIHPGKRCDSAAFSTETTPRRQVSLRYAKKNAKADSLRVCCTEVASAGRFRRCLFRSLLLLAAVSIANLVARIAGGARLTRCAGCRLSGFDGGAARVVLHRAFAVATILFTAAGIVTRRARPLRGVRIRLRILRRVLAALRTGLVRGVRIRAGACTRRYIAVLLRAVAIAPPGCIGARWIFRSLLGG